jgi:ketose-bisphosphate aldolase
MSVARLRDLLDAARRGGYCLGYFEAWDQYSLEACLAAAEAERSPAIVGFGGAVADQGWMDHRGVEILATLARRLAEMATVPAAVLFNEGRTAAQVERALGCGCNAVMLDTSHLGFDENVAATRRIVALASAAGADVEAELGQLADARDASSSGRPTDPREAARFVAATGVACLAVSAGGVHILVDREAGLDLDRLGALRAAVPVPLVLHGGTSIPDRLVPEAAKRGVAKINFGTRLKQLWLRGLAGSVLGAPDGAGVQRSIGSRSAEDVTARAMALVTAEVRRLVGVYGSRGRA